MQYKNAIKELENIISEIENEEVDIDILAEKVERAAELVKLCKQKLRTTEESVGKIIDGMNEQNIAPAKDSDAVAPANLADQQSEKQVDLDKPGTDDLTDEQQTEGSLF